MEYIAHISENGKFQTVKEHCRNTASYASEDLRCIQLEHAAYLAGLLHDCGKYSKEFTEYIINNGEGRKVIHTFAGVFYILNKYHAQEIDRPYKTMTAELIAYAIGAHHGLYDCINEDKKNGFLHRLNKQPDYEKESIKAFTTFCAPEKELDELFKTAETETQSVSNKIYKMIQKSEDQFREYLFYLGMLVRLLSSAVIDGDRRDTAEFKNGADFTKCIQADNALWKTCARNLEEMTSKLPKKTDIQKARQEISDICAAFSTEPPGIYRLNVPTGGGKTLSSLRYAINHAIAHKKKRIIYVAPFISILDQNSQEIKKAVKDSKLVLEHHSRIIRDNPEQKDSNETDEWELLTETWDSPIIITTLVQLLNTMFAGKTSCIRRFQSLCDSVIIIDEIQSVPNYMLTLFNLALNFIERIMNATIILCSATQPCLEELPHQIEISNKEIIPKDKYDHYNQIFKRTKLINKKDKLKLHDVSDFASSIMDHANSLLIICNTKKEAAIVFDDLKNRREKCFHLSASMCMAHRKEVLDNVKDALKNKKKIICVSTQVIEAGVDISFDTVIRITAGIDSIVQAAGRCNRNGENEGLAPVYIVHCVDEHLGQLNNIKDGQNASEELLYHYDNNAKEFDNDLLSDKSVNYYYKKLYGMTESQKKGYFDYPVGTSSLFSYLSDNNSFVAGSNECEGYVLWQAFKTAGELFEVFDHDAETVIVPYKKGYDIIAELCSERAKHDAGYLKNILNRSKEYTVSIYRWQKEKLEKEKGIKAINDGRIYVLNEEYYNENTGLQVNPTDREASEWNTQIL